MLRDCDACGGRYPAKRASSRYCSDRCRKRAQRAPQAPSLAAVPPLSAEQRVALSTLEDVTREELRNAGRDQTVLGAVALMIARRLESPSTDTGSSVAALAREYRATMAAALEGWKRERSPLDDLRERSAARVASAGMVHPHRGAGA